MTNSDPPVTSMLELKLFTGVPQDENFCRLDEMLATSTMRPSSRPDPWPTVPDQALPGSYLFQGQERSTADFLAETDTAALLVLRDGEVRHEHYALTGGPEVRWLSMSVAKSFVSALVGMAVEEGHIASIEDPLSSYVPVQPGSAYDGTSIRDVLQMSSGARWNEDYSDSTSDIFRLGAAMSGIGGGLDEFVATMVHECEPGTVCRYNSGDTQALGALLIQATGKSLADYMQVKLCEPLGLTSPSSWLVDPAGTEVAFGGLLMTARDFARIGEVFRNGGRWRGQQIVPAQWVEASLTADRPHLAPGRPIVGQHEFGLGYGYQWWLPDGPRGEFAAIGVYNQFVYVDPASRCTIVKLSANRRYGTPPNDEATNRELETVELLRAIAQASD
jgi:CubicO group peptidase (beta-lactamase class C family)